MNYNGVKKTSNIYYKPWRNIAFHKYFKCLFNCMIIEETAKIFNISSFLQTYVKHPTCFAVMCSALFPDFPREHIKHIIYTRFTALFACNLPRTHLLICRGLFHFYYLLSSCDIYAAVKAVASPAEKRVKIMQEDTLLPPLALPNMSPRYCLSFLESIFHKYGAH